MRVGQSILATVRRIGVDTFATPIQCTLCISLRQPNPICSNHHPLSDLPCSNTHGVHELTQQTNDPSSPLCPKCGYARTPFETECPRCAKAPVPSRSTGTPVIMVTNNPSKLLPVVFVLLLIVAGMGGYLIYQNQQNLKLSERQAFTPPPQTNFSPQQAPAQRSPVAPATNQQQATAAYNTQAYNQQTPNYQQPAPDSSMQQNSQALVELDKLVGDFNACMRRMDDSAAKQDVYFQKTLNGADADIIKYEGDKMDQEFHEFVNAANQAIQLRNRIAVSPLFSGNYREANALSSSAQERCTVPGAATVREAATYRYIERR